MSKTDSLHYQLCCEGAKWLRLQKRNYEKCRKRKCFTYGTCPSAACNKFKYVAVELVSWGENTDVWGLGNYNESAVIEVKVSHADFLADQKKACRSKEAEEKGYQAGTFRWYLCPEGIIKPEELPEKWGLLYWNGKKIYPVVLPKKFENTAHEDMLMLTSILRREEFPDGIFNYRYARPMCRNCGHYPDGKCNIGRESFGPGDVCDVFTKKEQ